MKKNTFIGLMIGISLHFNGKVGSIQNVQDHQNQRVCETEACHEAANYIKSRLDTSVDPCYNFYDFVCGTWHKKYEIPADKMQVSTFSLLRDEINEKVSAILKEPPTIDDPPPVKSAKNFYKSCMDTDRLNEIGYGFFKVWINEYIGGCPLLTEDWSPSSFDMTDVLINAIKHGVYPLFEFYVSSDNMNTDMNVLMIDQPSLGLRGVKYYLKPRDDPIIMAYEHFVYRMFQKLGFADQKTSKQDVKDVIDFEIELAKIHVSDETRRNPLKRYYPTTLGHLRHSFNVPGVFDFKKLVKSLFMTPSVGVYDVTDDEVIIDCSPSYFEELVRLIRDTPKRVIANYIMMRVVRDHISKLPPRDFNDIILEVSKAVYGVEKLENREKRCTSGISKKMNFALSYPFLKKNFDQEAKLTANEMINGLRDTFGEIIDELDWMDEATKITAKQKLHAVTQKIGYPDWVVDPVQLTKKLINNTDYEPDEYFKNFVRYSKEAFAESLRHLREPVDRAEWSMAPIESNAYYYRWMNEIVFPAGILQPPFFNKNVPKYLNYGGIGSVIGHEITHGFDDRGAKHNGHGNMIPWWSDSTVKRFKEKGQCIDDQYSKFTMPENNMTINGELTKGENIADNGGLKFAYRAYRTWIESQGIEEPSLPGLEYTNDQLFFIRSGQLWCDKVRAKAVTSMILTSAHCPGRIRAIGPQQNLPEFAKVFHCSKNSYMNPTNKCGVW